MLTGIALILTKKIEGVTKIFTIQEKRKKPWKDIGDFSIPMETVLAGESHSDTIARALDEEIGDGVVTTTFCPLGDFDILGLAIVTLYHAEVIRYQTLRVKNPNEAEAVRFMAAEEILSKKLRAGAKEMIEVWQKNIATVGVCA